MHQIQLSQELYEVAQRSAIALGFKTVDEFVADTLQRQLNEDAGNFDHRFTPEVIEYLDKVSAEAHQGGTMTADEVDAYFEEKRKAWREDRAS